MKRLALMGLLCAALILVAPAAANRVKGSVSVSPAAPTVGDNLVFSGCGYAANSTVGIVVVSPYATSFSGANTDVAGCFSSSAWGYTVLAAGSYEVDIYQSNSHHADSSLGFAVS